MAVDLAKFAKSKGVRFFLVNFTDLFGVTDVYPFIKSGPRE